MSKTTTNSSAAGNLYQARIGPNSNSKIPENHNLDARRLLLHHGKHAENSALITEINNILKFIKIENCYFKLQ